MCHGQPLVWTYLYIMIVITLVLNNYTSNIIEIDCIPNTLTSTIIVKLKQQFSRHSIPKNIIDQI